MANFVKVNSIDEANKKFKVILTHSADLDEFGRYDMTIPYPTNMTNSHEFKQALIKLDVITIECLNDQIAAITRNPNPVWCEKNPAGAGGILVREGLGAIILNIGLPATNDVRSHRGNGGAVTEFLYRYRELIPLRLYLRGNYEGIEPSPGGGGPMAQPSNSYCYQYTPTQADPMVCAIPFGKNMKYFLESPYTPDANAIYLGDRGDAANLFQDFTRITMQFTIELL